MALSTISVVTSLPNSTAELQDGTIVKLDSSDNQVPSGLYVFNPQIGWELFATSKSSVANFKKLTYLEVLDAVEILIDSLPDEPDDEEDEEYNEDEDVEYDRVLEAFFEIQPNAFTTEPIVAIVTIPNKLITDYLRITIMSDPVGVYEMFTMKRGVVTQSVPLNFPKKGTYTMYMSCEDERLLLSYNEPKVIVTDLSK